MKRSNANKQSTRNLKNENVVISDSTTSDTVLVEGCEGSTITINSDKIAKLIVDNSKDITVVVGCELMTAMVECINSQRLKIVFSRDSVKTIQIDNVQDSNLVFTAEAPPTAMFITTGNSTGLTVQLDSSANKLELPIVYHFEQTDINLAVTQFRTKFSRDCKSLITEKVVREGGGYVTTKHEKMIADERQALLERKIEEYVIKSMDIQNMVGSRLEKLEREPRPKIEQPQGATLLEQIQNRTKLNPTETKVTTLVDVVGEDVIIGNEQNTGDVTGAITNELELREYFDSEESVLENVKTIAELIRNSKHTVVYTGAGISTSASIPDYRGPEGVWTLRAKNQSHLIKKMDLEQAYPTYCHYALVELMKRGFVKHVVSTNVDGLHRRSGISQEDLSELHGNTYRESCGKCEKEYLRGFDVCKTVQNPHTHKTGRKCECGGSLKDSIIHFGENLPEKEFKKATKHSKQADVTLVLGTSMRVQPACSLPVMTVKQKTGRMIIVNLQTTPFDDRAYIITRTRTDHFMELLVKELGIEEINQEFDALVEQNNIE
jgi:mono-ADP-ribosyltransferase sirtuin 6